ncbi:hypothetical protein RQP46_005986 [Phenoliferia psychrophenolica]
MSRFLLRRPTFRTTLLLTSSAGLGLTGYTLLRSRDPARDDKGRLVPADPSSLFYGSRTLQLDSAPFTSTVSADGHGRPSSTWTPPTRAEMLESLEAADPNPLASAGGVWSKVIQRTGLGKWIGESQQVEKEVDEFDLVIVGGGATGAGVALDAAARGLKVALVERDDFSSGTSSKSTKLVHGGVRYLQKAVFELDYEQYKLVREALHERKTFLHTAPYLSHSLPIMLPIYKMNVAIVMTAVQHGATAINHVEVTALLKDATGRVTGTRMRDVFTGKEWNVKSKGVINATGPFADGLRRMDEPSTSEIVSPSSGIHITLPSYYAPTQMGLIDPATSDGRVIFFLPWQGKTIAGTTDQASPVVQHPIPQEEEIEWILNEVRNYLSPSVKVRRGDVLSAWSGLRPLVKDPAAKNTESLVRNHLINVSQSGLLTIAGGKWTTYRSMAEETVDRAIEEYGLKPERGCTTTKVQLVGTHGWSKLMYIKGDVAEHLAETYGDRAWGVCSMAEATGLRWPVHGTRLDPSFPYIDAEEFADATAFLESMGIARSRTIHLTLDDVRKGKHKKSLEIEDDFLSRTVFTPVELSDLKDTAKRLLDEVDANRDGQIELQEFLDVAAGVKEQKVGSSGS